MYKIGCIKQYSSGLYNQLLCRLQPKFKGVGYNG